MTGEQGLAFAVIGGMMAMFIWGRLRYDLVAGLALLVAVLVGVVPVEAAFTGFSNEILVIIAGALLVSAAVTRSRVIEAVLQRIAPRIDSVRAQLILLVSVTTVLSAFVKNIGALAMLLPVAFQLAKRSGASPSLFLMPMAFGSLVGGLMTLIGTSPNIIVSKMREELTGERFRMFDFLPAGLGLTIMGVIFLAFAYRLLPRDRKGSATPGEAIDIGDYVTEGRVGPKSTMLGETLRALKRQLARGVAVNAIVRRGRKKPLTPDTVIEEDDRLILEGEPEGLEQTVAATACSR